MKRREALRIISMLVVFLATLLGFEAIAEAQQKNKASRIGWLSPGSAKGVSQPREAIRNRLRELGYVENKNITFENLYAENMLERLPALANELVRQKVDVLLVSSPPVVLAAKNATKTIPIVFYNVADPVALGLVDSLARPGGNITGFTVITEVLAGKRLELLKDTVPKLSRVAVPWNPQNPGNLQQWKESQLPARALGLQLHSMEVSSADAFESAFKEATKARSAALAVAQETLFTSNLKLIADFAIKNRLPAIYTRGDFVDNGGLMSYGADPAEQFKRVAVMVDKILKGTNPADIPVEQPMGFELVMNLKTAKALRLTVPPIVLMRVTRVVK